MEKGQIVKCLETYCGYLTAGNVYVVDYVKGDLIDLPGCGSWTIKSPEAFAIKDDYSEVIFQADLCGSYGKFEVVS